jgi:hypothetical protein
MDAFLQSKKAWTNTSVEREERSEKKGIERSHGIEVLILSRI